MNREQLEWQVRKLCAQIDQVVEGGSLVDLVNLQVSAHELLQRMRESDAGGAARRGEVDGYDFAADDLAFDAWRETR